MKKKRNHKQQTKQLERQLAELERRMVDELSRHLGRVQNLSAADPSELLDIAADGELDYMSALSAEAGSATIGEIKRARQKIKDGTYGQCESCGRRITKRRLKARPFATLCIKCKEREERLTLARGARLPVARGESDIVVDLTKDDIETREGSLDDVFRDMEDVRDLY